jgi:hypothetical protein
VFVASYPLDSVGIVHAAKEPLIYLRCGFCRRRRGIFCRWAPVSRLDQAL